MVSSPIKSKIAYYSLIIIVALVGLLAYQSMTRQLDSGLSGRTVAITDQSGFRPFHSWS